MEKQFFAKIAVFALLGLNVGAYYVFWPQQNGGARSEAKAAPEEKGETKLMPAKPKELAPKLLVDAVPLSLLTPPKLPESKTGTNDELVEKLLIRIKEQTQEAKDKPAATPNLLDMKKIPHLPPPDAGKPGTLPILDGKPLKPENVGVTSPLTPKVPESPSPWSITVENAIQGQKLVIAKLNNPIHEFRIHCDTISEKLNSNEFEATGVLLDCSGIGIRCKRLAVPMGQSPRLVFEGDVLVDPGAPFGSGMRADRLVWDLSPMSRVAPAVLGAPK